MYVDGKGLFSDTQALTASAASTNVINLVKDGNLGIGEPMSIVIIVDVALDYTTEDETYVATLQTDELEAFGSPTTVASVTMAGGAVAGTRYVLPVPADTSCEEHIRVYYTLGGTTPTGSVTAFLIPSNMIDNSVDYASGYTIS